MNDNKQAYSEAEVIRYYENNEGLQKPEMTILEFLKSRLSGMKMLDIGVGGGRTTSYFAPLVHEYTGVDYSKGMVEVCKNKFREKYAHAKFMVADVRDLSAFTSADFDFVLFSFNGIDYITYQERLEVLSGIRRIIKDDGCFCFSSHNIQSLENIFKVHLRLNLPAMLKKIWDNRKLKELNQVQLSKSQSEDFVTVNDGAHDFKLNTCYVRPSVQVNMLNSFGFKSVRTFSLNTGLEFRTNEELNSSKDKWIYYLCRL